jgi:hypothetical protein
MSDPRSWRAHAAQIIRLVLAGTKGQPEEEIAAMLSDSYPYAARTDWTFKVWCEEIARQRGARPAPKPAARQPSLFDLREH